MTNLMLLNGLWQGAIIAGIAALITAALPERHAATRYAVWFVALVSLAIVPIASLWHPAAPPAGLPLPLEHAAAATSAVAIRAASSSGNWLVLGWLAGTIFFCFRLALSYVRIERIVRNAVPQPSLGREVLASADISVPIAARMFSPVVVIPAKLLASLEPEDLASIVQHERAHIRRGDIPGNLVQRLIEACFFFNPWVYAIGHQLLKEREAACDDWAVHASGQPHRYALCLANLGQLSQARPTLLTPSAIGSRKVLVKRVARLLNGKATALKVNYFTLGATVIAFGVLAAILQTSTGYAASAAPSASTLPANCYHDVKVVNAAMPEIAKADYRAGLSANALVMVTASGQPVSAKIVLSSGSSAIDQATVKAAMSSTYSAEISNCKAKAGTYLFHVETAP